MARVWSDERKLAHVARGGARRARRLGRARRRAARGGARGPRAGAAARARARRRARATHRPRPRRVRRRRPAERLGEEGRWLHYGLTSSDVVDTGLALQLRDAGALLLEGLDARARGGRRARRGAPRDALHRPHARRPRRADDLRAEARGLGVRARPRPRAAAPRAGRHARRQALRRRRDLRRRPTRRSSGSPASGSASSRSRSRRRSSRATGTPSCSRALALVAASLERFAIEIRHLARTEVREVQEPFGAAGRRARRRCRTSATRSSPSGSAGSRASCARPRSVGLENVAALARARHLALVGRAGRRSRTRSSRSTTCSTGSRGSSTGSSCCPSGCARTSTRATGSSSASGCCSRSSSRGLPRDEAYRLVQEHALRAWDEGLDFRALVEADHGSPAAIDLDDGVRPRRVHAPRRRRLRPPARPDPKEEAVHV